MRRAESFRSSSFSGLSPRWAFSNYRCCWSRWSPRRSASMRPGRGRPSRMRENVLLTLILIISPLSLAAIGGASSIYAPLQHQVVDVHQWLSAREFLDLFAVARVTPGPGSMLTTLIGWKMAGLPGALVAT